MKRRARASNIRGNDAVWLPAFLLFTVGFTGILVSRLSQAPAVPTGFLVAGGFFLLALTAAAATGGRGAGTPLMAAALSLAGLGLLARLRLGPDTFWPASRTDWSLPVGVAMALGLRMALSGGRHRSLAHGGGLAGALAIGVLAAVALFGRRYRGGLYLAGLTNPSEAIKALLPVCYAGLLSVHARELGGSPAPQISARLGLRLAVFAGVPLLLLVLHRDFGMALLLAAVLVVMTAMASGRPSQALAGFLLLAAMATVAFHLVAHARLRWEVWRDPFQDEAGSGWQVLQGLAALYHGGFWGRGLGAGFPHLVPIASSDFIYAVWGEEIGFIGCGLLLLLYSALFTEGLRIAGRLRDPFSRLLAGGWVAMLAVQTLLHVAGVTKAMPLTGIPLPLISHGGSSLVVSLAMIGVLTAMADAAPGGVGRRARRAQRKESQ